MKNSLKIFLRKIMWFTIALPFVWFLCICVWGLLFEAKYRKNLIYPYGGFGFLYQRLKQADTTKNVDLLIIGSSRAYRGIDPRFFKDKGINAFNLGSSLQTPVQSRYLLNKYIDRFNPTVVLFEVTAKTFSSDGVEGAIDVISNVGKIDRDLLDMVVTIKDVSVINTLAYSFFDKEILKNSEPDPKDQDELDVYVAGGFVERINLDYEGRSDFIARMLPLQKSQTRAFEDCLALLKKKNIPVILVQAPVLHDYYSSVSNQADFDSYFSSHHDIPYHNFSNSSYNSTNYFYDHQHLNKTGVTKFNQELWNEIHPHLLPIAKKKKLLYETRADEYFSTTSSKIANTSDSVSASTSRVRNGLKSAIPLK